MSRLSPRQWLTFALTVGLLILAGLIFATASQADIHFMRSPGTAVSRVQAQPTFWKGRTASVSVVVAPEPVRQVVAKASGSCYAVPGGPPASVIQRESGFDPKARNRSGAAGCYQFMPGTWGGYGGYASADQAPVEVQNEKAKQVWSSPDGPCHWRATTDRC